ncbi:hypothetical protein HYPSUDRAFT_147992, partial [Hypholoma sublateritium FD-334 SS-4]
RILGYLIHYVPTERGLKMVVEEICSCDDDSALLVVGKMCYDHYIRAFRANRGCAPTPSNHASRAAFDTIADMINDTIVDAPQSHANAKQNALIRDGYRCVVTGKYDWPSVMEIRELEEKVRSDFSLRIEATECVHIFAESANLDIGPASAKRDHSATLWAVMHRFGHDELPEALNGTKVHRLENVMTLVPGFHYSFDQLQVWFVATVQKNKYKLEAANAFTLRGYPECVTFTTPDQAKFPVPSPIYLAIHAACAKVAHLSGAAECIDKFYRDMGESMTLASDGTSATMLEHAIFELQAFGYETTV